MDEKITLFRSIHSHLNIDGYFINIDVILGVPPSFARSQYISSLNAEYGVSSYGTCHIDPNGGSSHLLDDIMV